ncbi:MAG: hypothetical protein JRG82_14545 [Deltaproteobacteria bacterium]|nr:hypothetical protein [Deltaproteobacteria bacterium]
MIGRTAFGVLAAGACITLGFMVYAGSPDEPGWWLGFLPFGAWGVLPFAGVAWSVRIRRDGPGATLLLVGAVLLTSASTFLLYQAFVAEPDAQSGIVFVFLPVWQILAMLPFVLGAQSLRSRAARMADDGDPRTRP